MRFRMPRRALPALLIALLGTACGGDDQDGATNPPADTGLTAEEQATALTIAGAFNAIAQAGNFVLGALHDARPQGGAGAADRLWDGSEDAASCPSLSLGSVQPRTIEFSVDFGSGCTTASGLQAAGTLVVEWHGGSQADTVIVSFQSFAADGYQLDGTLSAIGREAAWTWSFAGTVTEGETTWAIDAVLGVVVDAQGTPADPDDDISSFTGGGTIATAGTVYQVAITQTLILAPGCAYPVAGILTYQQGAPGTVPCPIYQLDFGTGDCCTVMVTVATRSEEIGLCAAP